ncbi:divalent metal cation transporter [Fluviicola sp.]|uniref:NRAMP family divalent metal transporter n=1 Tax=Fluviicola sp. TaxID=1917219 RepID=UPI0031D6F07B
MKKEKQSFLKKLGPGVITGASDDDPSGIATYSQAGAAFGYKTLWTALITFPLMAAVQETCARIGLVTKKGIVANIYEHYPRWVLYLLFLFCFPAIVMNIGADISAIGAVSNMLFPDIEAIYFSVVFTIILILSLVLLPYAKIALILKWLCITLFVYIIVPFITREDWFEVLKATFTPDFEFDAGFVGVLVAILGTTISPYLFFWQANISLEDMAAKKNKKLSNRMLKDMRQDVFSGMFFSNIVMFFIILTAGAVLFKAGIRQIDTVDQAAKALEPLAGEKAYLLFAIGVLGTGLLAIPVLSGSISYMFSEVFNFREGLDKKFYEAKPFYIILSISLILGLSLEYLGIKPVKALLYSAMLYGLTAPVSLAIILHLANNKKVMGKYKNGWLANTLGITTLIFMIVAAVLLVYLQFWS